MERLDEEIQRVKRRNMAGIMEKYDKIKLVEELLK